MATPDRRVEASESNRTLIIAVAIAAAVVIAIIFGFLLWAVSSSNPTAGTTLQGALRPGNPEFEKHKPNIALDEVEGFEAKRALGDLTMTLRTTVRNLTGKTITGLEMKGSVVDYENKPVKEKTLIFIPSERAQELLPNKTMQVQMMLDGMKDSDPRANIKMEVVGIKIKD